MRGIVFTGNRQLELRDRFRLDQAGEAYRRFDTQTTGKGVFTAF
jgi:hypothetical protein